MTTPETQEREKNVKNWYLFVREMWVMWHTLCLHETNKQTFIDSDGMNIVSTCLCGKYYKRTI